MTPDRDAPDTLTVRQLFVRKTRKPWFCTSCKRFRPAGTPRQDWIGTVDGAYVGESTCREVQHGLGCPFEETSWPLWRLDFEPHPDWAPTYAEHEKPFSEQVRARNKIEAEQLSRNYGHPGFLLARIEKIGDGVPDTGEAAP